MASLTIGEITDRLSNLQFSDVEKAVHDVIKAISQPNYFSTTKRGETHELRADLNSDDKSVRKETVKRVIAHMTIGKDVSSLFPDVLKNMQTDDVELKKLVYLYLMNYAKSQPGLVILAVNTFVKDADDKNPLIRALAIRTMSCIRVDKILDFVSEPLGRCLQDQNPYVRKTAAIAVGKLYEISPQLAEEHGFIQTLQDLVSDANPMVVANAVAALMDIQENLSPEAKPVFRVGPVMINKLLVALNECSEWGQIVILTALAEYTPLDGKEAELICDKVTPRLQHANGSVVLSAVKLLLLYGKHLENEYYSQLLRKMTPPLVTLLSSVPEVQYVALRNISLVLQREPGLLGNELRVFFCRYNDPPYVKLEKLEIMLRLVDNHNYDQLLSELQEYAANEVDVDFIRRTIRAIGRCCIKVEDAAERGVSMLTELFTSGASHVIQEVVVVLKDILRRYPHQYDSLVPMVTQSLELMEEPEARAAMFWMIGHYTMLLPNAAQAIDAAVDSLKDEPVTVVLQIITAAVKIFLGDPATHQDMVVRVLQTVTQQATNPDLRDRAYIYWRLLSTDPQLAKRVVFAELPPISMESDLPKPLLGRLLTMLGSIAAVQHRDFIARSTTAAAVGAVGSVMEEEQGPAAVEVTSSMGVIGDLLDLSSDLSPAAVTTATTTTTTTTTNVPATTSSVNDLLDLFDFTAPSAPSISAPISSPISTIPVVVPTTTTAPTTATTPKQATGDLLDLLG